MSRATSTDAPPATRAVRALCRPPLRHAARSHASDTVKRSCSTLVITRLVRPLCRRDLLLYTAPSAAPKGYTSYYLRNVSTGEAFNVISASLCATPLAECQATVAATPTPAARKSAAPAAALSAALAAAVAAAALL